MESNRSSLVAYVFSRWFFGFWLCVCGIVWGWLAGGFFMPPVISSLLVVCSPIKSILLPCHTTNSCSSLGQKTSAKCTVRMLLCSCRTSGSPQPPQSSESIYSKITSENCLSASHRALSVRLPSNRCFCSQHDLAALESD